jgi:hypothetical protein
MPGYPLLSGQAFPVILLALFHLSGNSGRDDALVIAIGQEQLHRMDWEKEPTIS